MPDAVKPAGCRSINRGNVPVKNVVLFPTRKTMHAMLIRNKIICQFPLTGKELPYYCAGVWMHQDFAERIFKIIIIFLRKPAEANGPTLKRLQ